MIMNNEVGVAERSVMMMMKPFTVFTFSVFDLGIWRENLIFKNKKNLNLRLYTIDDDHITT